MSSHIRPERRAPPHLPMVEYGNRPDIVFLTRVHSDRKPDLAKWNFYNLVREAWTKADLWLVGRFIILPDHIHLFCAPADAEYPALQTWVSFWKRLGDVRIPRCLPIFSLAN
jgi:putative transposase